MKKAYLALAVVLLIMNSIRVKAAEMGEPIIEGYYDEIEKDGNFSQYDEDGNIVASINVEDALFYVNDDKISGWGQVTINGKLLQGNIEDIFIYNSYFRCKFTTENTTYNVVVKVKYTTYQEWALCIEDKIREEDKEKDENNENIVQNKNNNETIFIEITCPIEQRIPY